MKKNIKRIAMLIIAGCFVVVSCKKKDNTTPTTPTTPTVPSNTSAATISGTSYSTTTQVILPNDSASIASGQGSNITFPSRGGYVSMMGSYFAGTAPVPGTQDTIKVPVYGYIFAQGAVTASNDTVTWGFTILSLGSAIKTGTYTISPSLSSDTAADISYLTSLLSGSGSNGSSVATGFYEDSQGAFTDSVSTGSVTISSINTADSTISGSYNLTVTGASGSIPSSVTISNAQFNNIHYQNFKTTN